MSSEDPVSTTDGCFPKLPVSMSEDSSKTTFSSTSSTGVCCRICQDTRPSEALITPCYCSGTMGYMHSTCLEKWLSQSARQKCELCNYMFRTKITLKGVREWLRSQDILHDRRYIAIDCACFTVLTPLGLISSWLCIQGAQQYYLSRDFWTGFGLVLLTGFLAMLYMFWVTITLRYHYYSFKHWQKRNADVHIVFSKCNLVRPEQKTIGSETSSETMETRSELERFSSGVIVLVMNDSNRFTTTTV